jgi:hypothetical protein
MMIIAVVRVVFGSVALWLRGGFAGVSLECKRTVGSARTR